MTISRTTLWAFFYQHLCKPVFFICDAETVHDVMCFIGEYSGKVAVLRKLLAWFFAVTSQKAVKIDGIAFPGKVGLAAGFDYRAQLPQILPSLGFGFATIGTVTYQPYAGNRRPRLGRLPRSRALLVNKGFKSPGAKNIITKLEGTKFSIPIGISIGSTNTRFDTLAEQISDIVKTFILFESSQVKHSYYELNISCPNTQGGQPFTTPGRLERLLKALKKLKLKKPVYIKMPIDYSSKQVLALLHVASRYSYIKGVIFGNLTKDKTNPLVDDQDRQVWRTVAGNLSGKPTWDRSNTLIALTKRHFDKRFTVIGTGGIFSPEDAQTKVALGADLVQLITGMVYQGPQLVSQINDRLR